MMQSIARRLTEKKRQRISSCCKHVRTIRSKT